MIIKKNSWHYWWLSHTLLRDDPMPKTLCTYFWLLVLSIVCAPLMALLFLGLCIVALISFPFMGTKWCIVKLSGGKQEANILFEWLKTKKRKVCPLIDYIDKDGQIYSS